MVRRQNGRKKKSDVKAKKAEKVKELHDFDECVGLVLFGPSYLMHNSDLFI